METNTTQNLSLTKRLEIKNAEQKKALRAWHDAGYCGSIIAGTGFGKTKCGVDAACYPVTVNPEHRSIILVPTIDLILQWKEEIIKFGYEDVLDKIEIVCFASAYKFKGEHYNTVVVDEVHLCLSPEYFKFFMNNSYNRLLCLTATIPETSSYRVRLVNLARPVYNLELDKAVEMGLVAPYKIYLLEVKLNKKEREEFDKLQAKFEFLSSQLGYEEAFQRAHEIISGQEENVEREMVGYAAAYLKVVGLRKELLHNNQRKLSVVKALAKHYKGEKIIVFNGTNNFSDKLEKHMPEAKSWHSGHTKKVRRKILEDFKEGKFDVLSTTKAANQGLSVDDAGIGVINGLTSKTITMIQRVGRLLRITEDKDHAIIVIPYVKDTQEENWLKYSLAKLKSAKRISKLSEIWK